MHVKDDALPEEILALLAAEHPGSAVTHHAGQSPGFTILWLKVDHHPLLCVREPGSGWPVTVSHYHGEENVRTDYCLCGPDHNPNRHRVTPEDLRHVLTKAAHHEIMPHVDAHLLEVKRQKDHTPIDTPQKLYDLCKALLDGITPASAGHTAAVKARAHRHRRRERPGLPPVPAPAPLALPPHVATEPPPAA